MAFRKLILHFDINQTVVVADTAQGHGPENALNTHLASAVWGMEESTGSYTTDNMAGCSADGHKQWVWCSNHPSLEPPDSKATSFYKYMEGKLTQRSTGYDRKRFKTFLGRFTSTEYGRRFFPAFQKLTQALKWKHPSTQSQGLDYSHLTVREFEGERYHFLLPSFIHALYRLNELGRDFAVVFRTFGKDADKVLQSLLMVTQGYHPDFKNKSLPLFVNLKPGSIFRLEPSSQNNNVLFRMNLPCEEKECITLNEVDANNAYSAFNNLTGVCAIRDDYQFWRDHNFKSSAAKPFVVDLEDASNQHIFFDDNLRINAPDNIVDVHILNTSHNGLSPTARPASLSEMKQLKNACLVQTNLSESLTNMDYFVDKILSCESNYLNLLSQSFTCYPG